MRIRRGLIAGLVLAAVAWSAGASAQAATHDPILFIHGWSRSSSDWSTMISRFTADGWGPSQLYTIDYDSSLSNKTIAEQVKQRVADIRAANGGAQVDVITHSMGGLSSRWYIKFLGGSADVEDWVSLGGPNHGTQTASGCLVITPVSCGEML